MKFFFAVLPTADCDYLGNAKVAGLEKDLGMKGTELNKALTIFYTFVRLVNLLLLLRHIDPTNINSISFPTFLPTSS